MTRRKSGPMFAMTVRIKPHLMAQLEWFLDEKKRKGAKISKTKVINDALELYLQHQREAVNA